MAEVSSWGKEEVEGEFGECGECGELEEGEEVGGTSEVVVGGFRCAGGREGGAGGVANELAAGRMWS